jgi:hypothetical protein
LMARKVEPGDYPKESLDVESEQDTDALSDGPKTSTQNNPTRENIAVDGPPTELIPTPFMKSDFGPQPNPRKKLAKRRKGQGYKYDWHDIRTKFIEGFPIEGSDDREFNNLVELSEKVNVPLQRLRSRCADERWYEQREQYQVKLARSRQTKRILELSKESVDFDSSSLKVAKLGIGMVTARMSEIARDVQMQQVKREEAIKLSQAGYDIDPSVMETVIDARELDMLSRAANQWQTLGQRALGTDIQRHEITQDVSMDIDVSITSVSAELGRDDPERLAAFLQAAKRAGLLETVMNDGKQPLAIETDVIDAEVVESEG